MRRLKQLGCSDFTLTAQAKRSQKTLKYLGYEDSVVNHTLLVKDISQNDYDEIDLEKRANANIMSKRFFTVQGIQHIESLTLSFSDLDIMKQDFKGAARTLLKD